MRTEQEVNEYRIHALDRYAEKGEEGEARARYETACWESGIPKTFWLVSSAKVKHNTDVFEDVIETYRKRWRKAIKHGYSLLLTGDNGSGKSMFLSYLLTQAIKRDQTAYYTTLAQLDIDIKQSFRSPEREVRLQSLLESDFVAIDEVGKENFKPDSFTTMRFELLMKQRYDDGEPLLLASNVDHDAVCEMYGSSIESMLEGRYQTVSLDPGDFRKTSAASMRKDMGYGL